MWRIKNTATAENGDLSRVFYFLFLVREGAETDRAAATGGSVRKFGFRRRHGRRTGLYVAPRHGTPTADGIASVLGPRLFATAITVQLAQKSDDSLIWRPERCGRRRRCAPSWRPSRNRHHPGTKDIFTFRVFSLLDLSKIRISIK